MPPNVTSETHMAADQSVARPWLGVYFKTITLDVQRSMFAFHLAAQTSSNPKSKIQNPESKIYLSLRAFPLPAAHLSA